MGVSGFVQAGPDGAHAAVHHVAWGDDVCTGFCLGNGLLAKDRDGFIV